MNFILDASALLAVMLNERGAETVIPLLRRSTISTVNLSEVYTKLIANDIPINEAQSQINRFELDIRLFDHSHAVRAAELRPLTSHLGLSFGDRACLALAQNDNIPVLTADQDWAKLDLGIEIRLIRERS